MVTNYIKNFDLSKFSLQKNISQKENNENPDSQLFSVLVKEYWSTPTEVLKFSNWRFSASKFIVSPSLVSSECLHLFL